MTESELIALIKRYDAVAQDMLDTLNEINWTNFDGDKPDFNPVSCAAWSRQKHDGCMEGMMSSPEMGEAHEKDGRPPWTPPPGWDTLDRVRAARRKLLGE